MLRRFVFLLVVFVMLAAIAPRAWAQFLSDEERRGMLSIGLSYNTREYDMNFRGSSVPLEDFDTIFEGFSATEKLDSIELTVGWASFGYVELRATAGLGDYKLTNTHDTDSAFNAEWTSSDKLLYGLSAIVRYPITDSWLIGAELSFMTAQFDDIEGDVSQLDVVPGLTTVLDRVDWREVTFTPMVMFRAGGLMPYGGVRLSDVTAEVNTVVEIVGANASFNRTVEYENAEDLGVIVGVTWRANSLIMADVHAQLLNNESISFAVKLTF